MPSIGHPTHIITVLQSPFLFTEFSEYLESVILSIEPLVITGDFNIHTDVAENHDAVRFLELLESLNLMQHVDKTTHVIGHVGFNYHTSVEDSTCRHACY